MTNCIFYFWPPFFKRECQITLTKQMWIFAPKHLSTLAKILVDFSIFHTTYSQIVMDGKYRPFDPRNSKMHLARLLFQKLGTHSFWPLLGLN